MEDLKRTSSRSVSLKSSKQHVVQVDATSLTSFPEPTASAREEEQSTRSLLNGLLDYAHDDDLFAEQTNPLQPQALAAASTKTLTAIIDANGPEPLVRRLAVALAERDAHITALRRLTEEHRVPQEEVSRTLRAVTENEAKKRAEQRKQDLTNAASESFRSSESESDTDRPPLSVNNISKRAPQSTSGGTMKGLTRLFGGYNATTPRRKQSRAPFAASVPDSTTGPLKGFSIPNISNMPNMPNVATMSKAAAATANFFRDQTTAETKAPVKLSERVDPKSLPPTLARGFTNTGDPQYVAWNRFITRLGEIRAKRGEIADNAELVGASRFGTEGLEGRKKLIRLVELVVGGIPMKLRSALWNELSGTLSLIEPDAYKSYLEMQPTELMKIDMEAIMKDIPRTLTENYDFYTKEKGADKLKNVLTAFVAKYEGYGYTQGLNMIAGYLLLVMPNEEDAFWMLCNMVDNFFPEDYFARATAMRGPLADCIVVREFIRRLLPKVNRHLDELQVDAIHTGRIGWMLTAFATTLPPIVLFRVWDVLLCLPRGNNFIIQAAVAMFSIYEGNVLKCEDEEDVAVLMTQMTVKAEEVDSFILCAHQSGLIVMEHMSDQRKIALRAVKKTPSLEMLTGSFPDDA